MVEERGKFDFHWELLGNIDEGRPNLGRYTRLEIYRLMQFTLRAVLEDRCGIEVANEIFYEAGHKAGAAFYEQMVGPVEDFDALIRRLQDAMREMKLGVLRVEKADLKAGQFVLTVSEDVDCSGVPELDFEICTYDEGFIAALMESYTQRKFKVKEVDCWCTGERTCRFTAEVIG